MAVMTRICGWCGRVLEHGDPGCREITHGICPACHAAWCADALKTIEAEQRKKQGGMDGKL